MNGNRKLFAAAAATLLIGGIGGAALAHPHPEGDGDGKKVKRVVVIRDGGDKHAKGERHRMRRFEIIGSEVRGCEGAEKIVDESSGEGDEKTKIILCRKGGGTTADTARHLEEALARISTNDELSAEQKARIETALRSALERARSAR